MIATRAEYTEALTLSTDAYHAFTAHMRTCPACVPVRTDCPTRDGLYGAARAAQQAVDDMVAGWANARRAAATPTADASTT